MKKTLLAIAIPALFAASAVNAATVYEKDGQKFDVYGRAQVNIYNDAAAGSNDNTLEGYGRIGLRGTTVITDKVAGFARGEWQIDSENSDYTDDKESLKTRHFYVGFDGGEVGKATLGQTDTAYYDAVGVTDIFNEWGSSANAYKGRQEGQIIYNNTFGGFRVGTSYQMSDDNASLEIGSDSQGQTIKVPDLDYGYAANVGYTFASNIGINAGYAQDEYAQNGLTADKTDWALSTSYGVYGEPGLYLAGLYNESNVNGPSYDVTLQGYELAAMYILENNWGFLAGYNYAEDKDSGDESTDNILVGAQYTFTSNFYSYAEYKVDQIEGADDQWTLALQYNY
jgi:outer membrane protein N